MRHTHSRAIGLQRELLAIIVALLKNTVGRALPCPPQMCTPSRIQMIEHTRLGKCCLHANTFDRSPHQPKNGHKEAIKVGPHLNPSGSGQRWAEALDTCNRERHPESARRKRLSVRIEARGDPHLHGISIDIAPCPTGIHREHHKLIRKLQPSRPQKQHQIKV